MHRHPGCWRGYARRRTIQLGKPGQTTFTYETYGIEDRFAAKSEGNVLFDTTCLGTNGPRTQVLTIPGPSTVVVVEVTPNCLTPGGGTSWNYSFTCPP